METYGRQPALGSPRSGGLRQIAVRMDDETFSDVSKLAQREGISFSEMAWCLIQWGLEARPSDVEKSNS